MIPFNQTLRRIRWREDDILPYTGQEVVVALNDSTWRAKTLPGGAQESRTTQQPGAPLSAATRGKQQFVYPLNDAEIHIP